MILELMPSHAATYHVFLKTIACFPQYSLVWGSLMLAPNRSMQGIFGASASELYLLIKSLLNLERTVALYVITK